MCALPLEGLRGRYMGSGRVLGISKSFQDISEDSGGVTGVF